MAAVNPEVNSKVDPVAAAYGAIGTSGRLPGTFDTPLLRGAVLSSFRRNGVNSLSVLEPGTGNYSIVEGLKKNRPIMGKKEFAVGCYNTTYPGYRKVMEAEWTNPAFQAELLESHQERGGWALLEEPLECKYGVLHVAEGCVQIDGARVTKIYSDEHLPGVYPAMNLRTKVAWTTTAPALGNNWSLQTPYQRGDPPCLFVRESEGGSRRSRRHKRSKRARKQKKRTRKH